MVLAWGKNDTKASNIHNYTISSIALSFPEK